VGPEPMELKHNVRLILRQESLQVYMKEPFRWVAACYRDWLWKPRPGRPLRAGSRTD
jgi:hypothetical protein